MTFYLVRSTLSVIAAYLDAFQKIADSATNAKGKTVVYFFGCYPAATRGDGSIPSLPLWKLSLFFLVSPFSQFLPHSTTFLSIDFFTHCVWVCVRVRTHTPHTVRERILCSGFWSLKLFVVVIHNRRHPPFRFSISSFFLSPFLYTHTHVPLTIDFLF